MIEPVHDLLDGNTFALIDQVSAPELPSGLPIHPVVPKMLEKEAHLMPLLVDLHAADEKQRTTFLQWMEDARDGDDANPVGALLTTRHGLSRLKSHLAQRLILIMPGNKKYVLRYFDSRVFVHLLWILDSVRLSTLFGPIQTWSFWFSGAYRKVSAPTTSGAASLFVERPQGEHIQRIGLINQVLQKTPRPRDFETQQRLSPEISAYIKRAQAYGWREQADLVGFAETCLNCHPNFDLHPSMQALIKGLPAREAGFSDAIALLQPKELTQIAEEMDARRTNTFGVTRDAC